MRRQDLQLAKVTYVKGKRDPVPYKAFAAYGIKRITPASADGLR